MRNERKQVDFFMGANAPDGFFSLYGELQKPEPGVRRFLIKGGAGTGKSSLMRKAAERCLDSDELTERIHCSSDPNSLDGVILHTGRTSLVDATPPHVIEPTYPGSFETVVNLCEYFDEAKLESRLTRIVELQTANGACHKKCRGLLKCANILLCDNDYYVEACTDFAKIDALAIRICKNGIPTRGGNGREHRRLLSAVTNQGVHTFGETPAALCGRVTVIKDEYGVAANALLQRIRAVALARGHTVFSCRCPLSPESKLEHLFLPETGLGFVTQNRWNDFSSLRADRTIQFTRFTDTQRLKQKKQYLSFNRRAAAELIGAAIDELRCAKSIHDELESQYTDAVDFAAVTAKTEEVCAKLAGRYDGRESGIANRD